MLHYIPASNLTSYAYPSPLSNPRNRYLAALAEAKAAEADYLAAEAARREEDDLRRRLAGIQQEQLLRSRYDVAPHYYLNTRPSYDRLSILQQQIEEEERLRLLALKEAELEERHRREQAAFELEAARLHREREGALLLRQQKKQARHRALLEQSAKVAEHPCSCGNQTSQHHCQIACNRPRKQAALVFHPSVQALLRPEAKVIAPVELKRQAKEESDIAEALLKKILGVSSETSKSKASAPVTTSKPSDVIPEPNAVQKPASKSSPAQANDVLDLKKSLEHVFQAIGLSLDQLPQLASQSIPSSDAASSNDLPKTNLYQEFAQLLNPVAAAAETNSQPSTSSSSSTPARDIPVQAAPAASAPAPVAPEAQTSNTPTQSLKEQLEARLNNEFHSEVRDTIQAIFESLRDSDNHERSVHSNSSSNGASSSKGKAKANDSSTTLTSAPASNPTSKNVIDSFNEVRSVDAAFHTLEADFTFPETLDFIPSHLVPDTPVSSDSESSSAITHLAYTSRNHPVRFYEQALSALLAQLDSIDSVGNDALRATRKEVVSRVEKALEELEKEVEGRYKSRLAKEVKFVPVETVAVPEFTTATTVASDLNQDSTPVPKTKEDPKESTSEPVITPEPALTATSTEGSSLESSEPAESFLTKIEPIPDDIPIKADEFPSLSSSSATVKGYEVQAEDTAHAAASSVETESTDAFLLTTEPETIPKRPNNKDSEDVASDWSEVEA